MEDNLDTKKRFLFGAITVLVVIFSIELLVRVLLATQVGPGILAYGTRFHSGSAPFGRHTSPHLSGDKRLQRTAQQHRNVKFTDGKKRRYSKYFPNENKIDIDQSGELFSVTINGDGFRGRDIDLIKKPGVVRVVTLGASSTFGYHNRDEQTYPNQLEKLLNEDADGETRYEVINLGIPHLTSDEIYAVFMDEALRLKPDVVTLYEGYNDSSAELKSSHKQGLIEKIVHEVCDTLVSVKFLVEVALDRRNWLVSMEEEESIAKRAQKRYVGNAEKIYEECRKRGIYFIVATQPSKSLFISSEDLRGVSYGEEEAILRKRSPDERKTRWELNFLTLVAVNNAVRTWAEEQGIPVVDVVKVLDTRRDLLLSWVHPGPEGNALIAEALAKPILQYEAKQQSDTVH